MAFTDIDRSIQNAFNSSGSTGIYLNGLLSVFFLTLTYLKLRQWYDGACQLERCDEFTRKVEYLLAEQEKEEQLASLSTSPLSPPSLVEIVREPELAQQSIPDSPELVHRHSIPMLVAEDAQDEPVLSPSKANLIELHVTEAPMFSFRDVQKAPLTLPATVTVSEIEALEA